MPVAAPKKRPPVRYGNSGIAARQLSGSRDGLWCLGGEDGSGFCFREACAGMPRYLYS